MNEGAAAARLGLKRLARRRETVMLARDLELVRMTGAGCHTAHVSIAGAVALLRQGKRAGLPVTAKVTPHHLMLTHDWVVGERAGPLADALRALARRAAT